MREWYLKESSVTLLSNGCFRRKAVLSVMKLGFIGAGNMSRSIIAGLVKAGYPAGQITAANPSLPKLEALASEHGIRITQSNAEAARDADSATRELTSDLVRSIRAFATNNNNPNAYVLAQIPAPNPAAPVHALAPPEFSTTACATPSLMH